MGDLARNVSQDTSPETEQQGEIPFNRLIHKTVHRELRVRPKRNPRTVLKNDAEPAISGSLQDIVQQEMHAFLNWDAIGATPHSSAPLDRFHAPDNRVRCLRGAFRPAK